MAQPQQTYYDLPFFYVFDPVDLTNGVAYQNLARPLVDDSDFILRRIVGIVSVANSFRYRDKLAQNRFSEPLPTPFTNLTPFDWPVVPEMVFPSGSQIGFDLGVCQKVLFDSFFSGPPGAVAMSYSQIAFQGVRRFYGKKPVESNYPYYSKPYSYLYELSVPVGRIPPAYVGLVTPLQHSMGVDNYDFELQSVNIQVDLGRARGWINSDGWMSITLYDSNQQAMSTAPVLDYYFAVGSNVTNSIFPVPTLVYPAGSIIRFDVKSLVTDVYAPLPAKITFNGASRFPVC